MKATLPALNSLLVLAIFIVSMSLVGMQVCIILLHCVSGLVFSFCHCVIL